MACSGPPVGTFQVDEDFSQLPDQLSRVQAVFSKTGGLHVSALFDPQGQLLMVREDVGRHNALDKLVGTLFLEGGLPASDRVLLVSGRASYDLVQKAVMAGIPALAAVGAPSSLAIDMAREFNMTLIGFLRDGRFNVYAGAERVAMRKTSVKSEPRPPGSANRSHRNCCMSLIPKMFCFPPLLHSRGSEELTVNDRD